MKKLLFTALFAVSFFGAADAQETETEESPLTFVSVFHRAQFGEAHSAQVLILPAR